MPRARRGGPLLQQQLGGPHPRIPVEAVAHQPVEQHGVEAEHRHALMVGHEALHHRVALVVQQPAGRVVHRLVESVVTAGSQPGEVREVVEGRPGVDHRREPRGIGRDDQVIAEPAHQPQPGHAER